MRSSASAAAGPAIDLVREPDADNRDNVKRSARGSSPDGHGLAAPSFARPHQSAKTPLADVPPWLRDRFNAERNDLTAEVLKNLDWLGVDRLIPIGGDDTLSYGARLSQKVFP